MASKILVFTALCLLTIVSVAAPAAQAAELVSGKCVWIVNGPSMFTRACVDPSSTSCPIYTERWTWEGGYRKTCVPGSLA